jgi:hypothetical protein
MDGGAFLAIVPTTLVPAGVRSPSSVLATREHVRQVHVHVHTHFIEF